MSDFNIPSFKLGQLAQVTGGELNGDPALELKGFSPDPLKATPDQLCFVFRDKYIKLLNDGELKAGAYLVPTDIKISREVPYVAVKRPKLIIKQLLEVFAPKRYSFPAEVHPLAVVDPSAKLGKNVKIGPHVFVGPNSSIGDNTELQSGVKVGKSVVIGSGCTIKYSVVIEDRTKIGNRVIIHPNTVIGADGFSYVTEEPSNLEKIQLGVDPAELKGRQKQLKVPSAGWVEIGDDVEIGANTCVDRGTIGPTVVGRGTKVDNHVQIAHNCKIGEDCLLAGHVALAGSVVFEDGVIAGGKAVCSDNLHIGHDSVLTGAAEVTNDLPPYSLVASIQPAKPMKEYLSRERSIRRTIRDLPKIKAEIDQLKKKVKGLEG
ncbi:MAG: UDP-3-O-(3-hydroxymyristoyl)glucosamine N-acyltransferase [Candidatus Caenarcaniphilales bacterium]|nr:UDP-3-O-(3-hydroxymyristoyl)glucosamine N-acyltransferase [Candidatus Caenarcaniphilales bacterium]